MCEGRIQLDASGEIMECGIGLPQLKAQDAADDVGTTKVWPHGDGFLDVGKSLGPFPEVAVGFGSRVVRIGEVRLQLDDSRVILGSQRKLVHAPEVEIATTNVIADRPR